MGQRVLDRQRKHRFCPTKVVEAPGLWDPEPHAMHSDEWLYTARGHVRMRSNVALLAALPNGASTWFLHVLEEAQHIHGNVAIIWDGLHPYCNALLAGELSKLMGAPEDGTWLHTFREVPSAGLELLMELLVDHLHAKAVKDVQFMRVHGMSQQGQQINAMLRFPWQNAIPKRMDPLRTRLIVSKEVINVMQLAQYAGLQGASAAQSGTSVLALYRHRAHSFPMSNGSSTQFTVCKWCMFEKVVHAFETNTFRDAALRGLQRWWRGTSRLTGGAQTACGQVFAHLVMWYGVLRVPALARHVLDFAKLMSLERLELQDYLNVTLPGSLRRYPGIPSVVQQVRKLRFENPLRWLAKRESAYAALGVEAFALSVIAEMSRLSPDVDLSLLRQPANQALVT